MSFIRNHAPRSPRRIITHSALHIEDVWCSALHTTWRLFLTPGQRQFLCSLIGILSSEPAGKDPDIASIAKVNDRAGYPLNIVFEFRAVAVAR
jgi:hypothetical protein